MTAEGASQKDLYTFLFVPEDSFKSWFANGRELVNQEYGRATEQELNNFLSQGDLTNFDILCLLLYKGIMSKRWSAKRDMHKIVAQSANPQLAFKYLEAVYEDQFNPRYKESGEDILTDEDESATSYVMEEFIRESKGHADITQEDNAHS